MNAPPSSFPPTPSHPLTSSGARTNPFTSSFWHESPGPGHVRIPDTGSVNSNIYPESPARWALTACLLSQSYVHVNKSATLLRQPAHSSHGGEAVKNGYSVLKKKKIALLPRTRLRCTLVETVFENFVQFYLSSEVSCWVQRASIAVVVREVGDRVCGCGGVGVCVCTYPLHRSQCNDKSSDVPKFGLRLEVLPTCWGFHIFENACGLVE